MNKLQVLLTEKFNDGTSYNRLEHEIGINHVSLSQYHKKGVEPSGKNLALLAKYFRVDFWELLEEVNLPLSAAEETPPSTDRRRAVELRMLIDELEDFSPIEQLELLLRIRKERATQKR